MKEKEFFSKDQLDTIVKTIEKAELQTSGEIRLHIESRCKGDALQRAIQVFKNLNMHKTDLRNGTLVYLATTDRKFAIVGDKGINEKVPKNFWQDVKEKMSEKFKQNDFESGVTFGIELIGEKLKEYFPYQEDDINELSNDVSFGD